MPNRSPETAYLADERWRRRKLLRSRSGSAFWLFAGIVLVVVCLDAATKVWAHAVLPDSPIAVIPGFFRLAYVQNSGIAFGLFQGHGRVFTYLSPVAFLFLGCCLGWHVWRAARLSIGLACGLIVGGAFGNVWSRLADGYVTDFLDFYLGGYHWPAFNLADSSLCCGVALYLFLSHSSCGRRERKGEAPEALPDQGRLQSGE